jgi:hypothetical protein
LHEAFFQKPQSGKNGFSRQISAQSRVVNCKQTAKHSGRQEKPFWPVKERFGPSGPYRASGTTGAKASLPLKGDLFVNLAEAADLHCAYRRNCLQPQIRQS